MDEVRYAQRKALDDRFEAIVRTLVACGVSRPEATRELAEFAMGVCHESVCELWEVHRKKTDTPGYFGRIFKSMREWYWRVGLTCDAREAIGRVEHRYGLIFQAQMDILYPKDETP